MTQVRFCPECGYQNSGAARYCGRCGSAIPTLETSARRRAWALPVLAGFAFLLLALAASGAFLAREPLQQLIQDLFHVADESRAVSVALADDPATTPGVTQALAEETTATPMPDAADATALVALTTGATPSITTLAPSKTLSPSPEPSTTPTASHTPTETPSPTPSPAPAMAPPRGQIVFTCFIDGFDNLCRIDADGSGERRLTQTEATDFYASYSPDGQSIVFSSRRSGEFHLYAMGANGENPRRISPNLGSMFAPAVSPDGRQIAFTNAVDGRQSIWVMNIDGSNPRALTDNAGNDLDPVWSPDGSQIAFGSDRSGAMAHHVMNADGTEMHLLETEIEEIGGRSDWSPDGQWLAFYAGPRDDRDIYLVATDGSGSVQRLTHAGNNLAPSFSPDGQWITFTSYRTGEDAEIFTMRVDGSDVRQLTDNDRPDWQPRWGP